MDSVRHESDKQFCLLIREVFKEYLKAVEFKTTLQVSAQTGAALVCRRPDVEILHPFPIYPL